MLTSTLAVASDGLLAVKSPHSAKDTMERLETLVPAWLAKRHGVADCPAVGNLSKALAGLMAATIQP